MKTNFNVTGSERKRLVRTIAASTGETAKYLGMPSMAYEIGPFTVSCSGELEFSDRTDTEVVEKLYEDIAAEGFEFEAPESLPAEEPEAEPANEPQETEPTEDTDSLTVSLPLDGFNPDSLDRLQKLVDSKATLIRKALGAERLTIRLNGDKVEFPWWDRMPEPEETQAYLSFIAAVSAMAKEAKRVVATEKEVESEKYAFRGFLLRLGFIGAESKAQRKVLLQRLSGSAAFPNKQAADAFSAAQKAKRDAAKAAAAETKEVADDAVSE